MIRTQDIMKSLPLVASVLGDKYGVTVNIGGKNAYTDGKSINLPTLPLDCKDKLLMLARAYIDHESAHIRETDFEAVRQANLTPIQHHIWNILEDFRVEQKLAALFPGCRQHFRWLIEHLFAKDTDDEAGASPAFSVLNWLLLTVRAWEVPAVGHWRDKEAIAADKAFPGLRAKMQPVLMRVRQQCQSTQEAIAYALELSTLMEQYARGSKSKPEHNQNPDAVKSTPEASTENEQTDLDTQSEQAAPALEPLLSATSEELPVLAGEWLAEQLNLQHIPHSTGGLKVARSNTKAAVSFSDTILTEALRFTVALRSRLHGLLQTQIRQPCIPGRRGKLNATRLHALAVNNPRVFVKWGERQGLSTAVHVLLDASGSMCGTRMDLAARACYALSVALEQCKVNVGVTAFPAQPTSDGNETTVAPLVRHGEKVHTLFDICPGGGTPLGESLWWVMQQMCGLKENRKIILILTDGLPSSFSSAEYAQQQAKILGFEVMGLGIQDANLSYLLPSTSRTIHNLSDLAPAMFDLLQSALIPTSRG